MRMDFKTWLRENYGTNGGLEPPLQHPELFNQAMPRYGGEPLPGNKRAMKKDGKKTRRPKTT